MLKHLLTATGIMASMLLSAQKNFWTPVQNTGLAGKSGLKERRTLPTDYKIFSLNMDGIKSELAKAPARGSENESLVLKFPNAEGKLIDYVVQEASVMAKELSDKYPGIKSYVGYQKNNNGNTIRLSLSPYDGINVMYFNNSEVSYLDTYSNDLSNYIVYKRKNLSADPEKFNCGYDTYNLQSPVSEEGISLKAPIVKDGKLRTYRLALACTIEYAAFHIERAGLTSGTIEQKKAAVLAAMNASMTRVNGVYEKTVSLTMVLVPNNDQIIFIDSDDYDNENSQANGYPLLNQNQAVCDSIIGTANYDIGHVFSTASGGVAALRSPCNSSNKARGTTGTNSPINDAFNIDYVAHEMGHQFGANHTFRANTGSCRNNANESTAVEPGSGTTIMAYAGICGANNVQGNSDPYFHSVSVNEIYNFIIRPADCSSKINNNNTVPTADAGLDYTIPYGTAFVLAGQGSDPDGDALTYLWEQTDTASLSSNPQPPTASTLMGTVFRSYSPTIIPERYIPSMASILSNNLTPKWEVIPNVARTLNFSLLVNDNRATGNQTARDLMKVTVAPTGPFKVTSQTASADYVGGSQLTVTWDVAGTNAAPINTSNVQVLISSDNGLTYPTVIAESVLNNGSATVTLPNLDNPNARIMVKAVGNIYFAVNAAKLNIKKNLAVEESALSKDFDIYPNPAKGEVNISLTHAAKDASYQILDLSGKLLFKGNLKSDKNQVNISNLPAGTYRIIISNNGEINSKNLIVK